MKLPHSCKREEWKGVPQKATDPIYQEKRIAIIGYSARAINYVAKAIGMKTRSSGLFCRYGLEAIRG